MKKINFIEENSNKNKAIIFLHPKNIANWIFDKQFNQFNDYNLIFIDLPNHGDSFNLSNFSISEVTDLLKDFIIKLNKEEVNLIGIDLGGQISLDILSKYPELINKVIISGVELIDEKDKVSYDKSIVNVLDETKAILDSKDDNFLIRAYLRYFGIGKEYIKDISNTFKNQDYENLKKISYESLNYSIDSNPKDPNKDLLVCFGSYDTIWCKSSVYEIKKVFKNAKILKIEKATNLWNVRHFKEFNQLINNYLKSQNTFSLEN
ncbi:alpha/beta fold hydrolase [Methanobrevibacter sp. DSM 116169]|uniref:alpha/beta fold hydrolase n=1 Tax=Methanobrevibacter sp. DSM 116169 TaxID=3242727 RepID=UPI0038FC32BB